MGGNLSTINFFIFDICLVYIVVIVVIVNSNNVFLIFYNYIECIGGFIQSYFVNIKLCGIEQVWCIICVYEQEYNDLIIKNVKRVFFLFLSFFLICFYDFFFQKYILFEEWLYQVIIFD